MEFYPAIHFLFVASAIACSIGVALEARTWAERMSPVQDTQSAAARVQSRALSLALPARLERSHFRDDTHQPR